MSDLFCAGGGEAAREASNARRSVAGTLAGALGGALGGERDTGPRRADAGLR